MRLLHTSDWHLGRTLYGEDMLAHQAAFLAWLLEQAAAHEVAAVLVAGDVYDRAVPPVEAVAVLDHALRGFADEGIAMIITSGNHDSAIRLGFGSRLSELAGIHLRTDVADIARPVMLADADGEVAVYGIPYLLPDAVMAELGAERSHASVLAAATALIRADAEERGIARTVVVAHAFVTGGLSSASERDIRVGGIGDVPASVFAGHNYVALGHLHGQQTITVGGSGGSHPQAGAAGGSGGSPPQASTVRYSGSPLAFSFSEWRHAKSVTLVDIDAAGLVTTTKLATPVPRRLREVRGTLEGLLARAQTDLAGLADAWVKVVLTDTARAAAPMERLREKWPHTLVLDFAPEGELAGGTADLRRLAQTADPVEICGMFVEFTSGGPPDDEQQAVLADVVEAALRGDLPPPVSAESGSAESGSAEAASAVSESAVLAESAEPSFAVSESAEVVLAGSVLAEPVLAEPVLADRALAESVFAMIDAVA
jgi:DNA repair protein SbcD/Mre11